MINKQRMAVNLQQTTIPSKNKFKTSNLYFIDAVAYFLEKEIPISDIQSRKLLKEALNAFTE